MQTSTNE